MKPPEESSCRARDEGVGVQYSTVGQGWRGGRVRYLLSKVYFGKRSENATTRITSERGLMERRKEEEEKKCERLEDC